MAAPVSASPTGISMSARRWPLVLVAVAVVIATLVDRVAIASGEHLVYKPTVRQWVLVSLMVVMTAAATITTGFFRRWTFWRPATHEPPLLALANTILALIVLVETFVAVTALLASAGVVSVTGFELGQPVPVTETTPTGGFGVGNSRWGPGGSEIYRSIEAVYLWHLLDAVPVLEVTKTLNWTPAHMLNDHPGGGLILAFKVLVALPVITLLKGLLTKPKQPGEQDAGSAAKQ